MTFPLVQELAAEGFPVRLTCGVLGFSRQAFYKCHRVGEGRVHRLCRQQRVWSTTTRKGRRRSGRRPGVAVHDDLVQREFRSPARDLVWLTDITEHATSEGKLYCCAVKDVFSNRIVGYAIDERMTAPACRRRAAPGDRAPPAPRHRRLFTATADRNFARGHFGPCSAAPG